MKYPKSRGERDNTGCRDPLYGGKESLRTGTRL
jgi:hypothetical protein